jgi:O-antigen ligase
VTSQKTIAHKNIFLASFLLSVITLPFSVKLCHGALICMTIAWLLEGNWTNKIQIVRGSVMLQVVFVFFTLHLAGLVYTENTDSGWFNIEKKVFFLTVPLVLATTEIKLTERHLTLILYAFVLACFAGSLICIYHAWDQASIIAAGELPLNQYLATSRYSTLHPFESETWLIFSYVSLAEGINIHPTYFSLYLAFCIAFIIQQLSKSSSRFMQAGLVILALYFAFFIIFLAARIIIVGVVLMFLFSAYRSLGRKQMATGLAAVAFAILGGWLLYINPVSRYRSLQEINISTFSISPDSHYENAAQIRVSLWWLAIKSIEKSNPIWGSGTGDVEDLMKITSSQYRVTNVMETFDPHNQYLYTYLCLGFTGLLFLTLCLGLPVYFAWLHQDNLFLTFSFLFILLCFTETAFELQKGIAFYTLFCSLFAFQSHSFQRISIDLRPIIRAGN